MRPHPITIEWGWMIVFSMSVFCERWTLGRMNVLRRVVLWMMHGRVKSDP